MEAVVNAAVGQRGRNEADGWLCFFPQIWCERPQVHTSAILGDMRGRSRRCRNSDRVDMGLAASSGLVPFQYEGMGQFAFLGFTFEILALAEERHLSMSRV